MTKKIEPLPDILTAKEAAAFLRVSRQTLYALCDEGLPHQRVGSGKKTKYREYRFKRTALEDWLAKGAA